MLTIASRLDALNRIGRALADPTRARILLSLLDAPSYPAELAQSLDLTRSNVSNHLACLRDCGLVEGRSQGRSVYYSLSHPELMDMLAQAEVLLAATGSAVSLCPTYGPDGTTAPMTEEENAR